MTDRQLELLRAIAKGLNGSSGTEQIAHRLGYRPARNGVLAVSAMCKAINRAYPSDPPCEWHGNGKYLFRLPPRDQYDHARYGLTKEGARLAGEKNQ